jgi:hypothetical protein
VSLNEDYFFPLLLSQRERSAIALDIQLATSKAEVADILRRHGLSFRDPGEGGSGADEQESPDS